MVVITPNDRGLVFKTKEAGIMLVPRTQKAGSDISFWTNSLKGGGTVPLGQEVTIDNTGQALSHYLFGDGSAVNIGINTVNSLLSSPEFINAHEGIIHNPAVTTGRFSVNMTWKVFHIGNTSVSFIANFDNKTVTYKLFDGDGFWDADFVDEYFLKNYSNILKPDGPGPNLERLGGTPYYYNPLAITLPF